MGFRPEEVLFSPTAECNLDCPHCDAVKSKTVLSIKAARTFLGEAKRLGVKKVGFSGGEPFLNPDFLVSAVKCAVKEGMSFDKIMTNGVWYSSDAEADSVLSKLRDAGYDGTICVSVDAFHSQQLEKLARFINMAFSVWERADIATIACTSGALDVETNEKFEDLAGLLKARFVNLKSGHSYIRNENLFIKIYRIELAPVGKAAKLKNPWDNKWFKEDRCKGPGNVFFVLPDGSVKPCCGYATNSELLTIGNINTHSAKKILSQAKKNRFVSTVFDSGLTAIRRRLERLNVKFPGKSGNNCYFCNYVLTEVPRETLDRCLN